MKTTQITFGAGEISPEMQGRIDSRNYQQGLEECSNFIIRPQGIAQRRVGMRRAGSAYSNDHASRLVPFSFNDEESYAIELSHERARVWQDGELLRWGTPLGGLASSFDSTPTPNTITFTERHGLASGTHSVRFIGDSMLGLTPGNSYTVTVVDAVTVSTTETLSGSLSGDLRMFLSDDIPRDVPTSAFACAGGTGSSGLITVTGVAAINDGDRVRFTSAGTLPSEFRRDVTYFVLKANPSTAQVRLALRKGGEAITYTGGITTCELARYYLAGETMFYAGSSPAHGVYRATEDVLVEAAPTLSTWDLLPTDGVYTFDTPYDAADLHRITYTQSNDVMTLAHPSYQVREIVRYGEDHWQTRAVSLAPNLPVVTGVSAVATRGVARQIHVYTGGRKIGPTFGATAAYVLRFVVASLPEQHPGGLPVTNLNNSGRDLATGDTVFLESTEAGVNPLSPSLPDPDPSTTGDIGYYLVTKSENKSDEQSQVELQDEDGNVVYRDFNGADTALSTPINLYAVAADADRVQRYKVTALDADRNESLGQSDDDAAEVANVLVTSGASNLVSWDATPGAVRYRVYREFNGLYGLIAETEETSYKDDNSVEEDMSVTPPIADDALDGTLGWPRAVGYFEQRRVFGGTDGRPRSVYMTRTGTESDLSYSLPVKDTDRISLTLASRQAAVIRHIVGMQDMILLTQQGEWRMLSINNDAITPETVGVRQQTEVGASLVQPLMINNVVVYGAARGGHVRQLSFNYNNQGYLTGDLSLRATHLFDNYTLSDATFQKAPYPIMWWVSSSGRLLACTYIPEEELMAWHQHSSPGATFESVCSVSEGLHDTVYVVVNRGGQRSIERMVPDIDAQLTDGVFTDAAVVYDGYSSSVTLGATLSFEQSGAAQSGASLRATWSQPVLHPGDVGRHVAVKDSGVEYWMQITRIVSGTQADVRLSQSLPESVRGATLSSWALAVDEIDGLEHLEGQDVQVVTNGGYLGTFPALNGWVSLPVAASTAVAGLGYTSTMKTLPQVFQTEGYGQGMTKIVSDVWMRVIDSAGLEVGPSAAELVRVDDLSTKELKSGEFETAVPSEWTQSGQIMVQQSLPLPARILNLTMLSEVGS